MNKRLKEIEDQCWYQEPCDFDMKEGGLSTIHTKFDRSKFAEMIVRECARSAALFSIENKRIHPDIDPRDMPETSRVVYHSTCQAVAFEIKEQFGVEQ